MFAPELFDTCVYKLYMFTQMISQCMNTFDSGTTPSTCTHYKHMHGDVYIGSKHASKTEQIMQLRIYYNYLTIF